VISTLIGAISDIRTRHGMKLLRFGAVSAFNVILGQILLYAAQVVMDWNPVAANTFAVCIRALPAYFLSRYWVWEKKSKNQFMAEVIPFWTLAFIGYAVSTIAIWYVDTQWAPQAWVINMTSLAAYGIVWMAKFVVLDRVLFRPEEAPAV
jgi:putative flippase GtrA